MAGDFDWPWQYNFPPFFTYVICYVGRVAVKFAFACRFTNCGRLASRLGSITPFEVIETTLFRKDSKLCEDITGYNGAFSTGCNQTSIQETSKSRRGAI